MNLVERSTLAVHNSEILQSPLEDTLNYAHDQDCVAPGRMLGALEVRFEHQSAN